MQAPEEVLRREWPGILQWLDPEGICFSGGMTSCRRKFAFCLSRLPHRPAIRVRLMVIFSHSFSFFIIWYRFFIARSRDWRRADADGSVGSSDWRQSIQPDGGVWRKFCPDIFQRVDASTDFGSGRSGSFCARAAAVFAASALTLLGLRGGKALISGNRCNRTSTGPIARSA